MKKIDLYIIKKYFVTFFFSIILLLALVIVIDISEKIDDFIQHDLNYLTIISEYYLHFIPYFANLFSPLFIFISVIFFTSRLAQNSEIIAIYNTGMSFNRLLRPFIISSVILMTLSYTLANFIIPESNKHRIDFENKYLNSKKRELRKNIHIQKNNSQYYYFEGYNNKRNIGYKFSLENIEDGILKKKIRANYIQWNKNQKNWSIHNYEIRKFKDDKEIFYKGSKLDTILDITPDDFTVQINHSETMTLKELNNSIKNKSNISSGKVKYYKIEKHKRIAFPFAILILTIIAVTLSSKKERKGLGKNLGIGLLIAFSYILFFQFSSTLATNGNLEPWIAVWIPNLIYINLGFLLLIRRNKI
tara:strand:- start:10743 stop:11822 length:1080 start_codon:yes stop_codon:yes gene_type:complete